MPVLAPFEIFAMERGMEKGLKEGREKGRKEGKKEGKKEGMQIGSIKEAQATIMDILRDNFGRLPSPLIQSVKNIDDLSILRKLRKQALRVDSLETFDQIMKEFNNHQPIEEN